MAVWYTARTMGWPAKAMIIAGLFAVLRAAAVPAALSADVVTTLRGTSLAGWRCSAPRSWRPPQQPS